MTTTAAAAAALANPSKTNLILWIRAQIKSFIVMRAICSITEKIFLQDGSCPMYTWITVVELE
jgi:hypothetical protein